ncbi:MAG: isocitrate lyase/PEP mutase family protein [Pseudomonadales bacterium]|nr:isocitrate lyase/PEP mutase family protein [Pseudomonadales bacterium]MBO6701182.1 isocitrate lyase/PEP mutase family protein [Pseudomonadales bacterium]MBO7006450.1 isocitrate lyase/PEP mutase family protein [Pseudomonadales bacterium]
MSLRKMFERGEFLSAPGVFDPLSARVAEASGARVLYMTGYGVSASLLGKPDAGLVSYREMVDRVRSICDVTSVPLIADGDTGFGGLANVQQAVQGYEAAGAGAIQIEDQEYPKRCGHTRNRKVIPTEDMVRKIKLAVDSKQSNEFMIIARTDARTEHGMEEALNRAGAYIDAGADILFFESPESVEEMRTITRAFPDVPKLANMVSGGKTPILQDEELKNLGYQLVIHPVYLLGAAARAMQSATDALLNQGGERHDVADLEELNALVDFPSVWALDDLT